MLRFRDISITKKLFLIMAIMAILITTELVALTYTIKIFSAVRAYVGGEGLWSKAQKNAAYYLMKYAYTKNEEDYQNYLNFLKVPLSDHQARLALSKQPIDYADASKGFLGGRIHPDDIEGVIWLFSKFNRIYYIHKAITIWTKADELMEQFLKQGEQLHQSIVSNQATPLEIANQLTSVDKLNNEFTIVEDEFSYTLGEASRWLEDLVFKLLISIAITVEFTGIILTVIISIKISKDIDAMNKVAKKVAKSDFSERAHVSSGDEIGQLAISFNTMIDELNNQKQKVEIERFSKNQLQNILESSIEHAIIATNLDGVISLWNEGATRNYGYSADEMVGKQNIRIICTQDSVQSNILSTLFETAFQEEKADGVFECARKDGSHFLNSVVISLRHNDIGNAIGYVIISKDITKQIQLEQQLIKNNQELEQFAYVASHDLKAPLRAIERLSSWVEEDSADKLNDQSKKNLSILRQRVNRMSRLIDGILQYSRIGRVDVQINTVDTKQLLQDIIDTLNPAKTFTLHYPNNLPVFQTNDVQLTQVFSNLISNSIKHHHHDTGNIEIHVRDLGNFYEFSVKDDGPGIEPEYHEKIFQIFQTLQSKDELESTGIGLSIVKKIVESYGGKISVTSKKDEGATFCFMWPKYLSKIQTKNV